MCFPLRTKSCKECAPSLTYLDTAMQTKHMQAPNTSSLICKYLYKGSIWKVDATLHYQQLYNQNLVVLFDQN